MQEHMILIDTLSESSQNHKPYCNFSGLGDCPNKIILSFPSPEEMPTLIYGGIPQMVQFVTFCRESEILRGPDAKSCISPALNSYKAPIAR